MRRWSNEGRTNHYFLTSRFSFPFFIIALFFGVSSLFTGFLAMCTRIGSYLSSLLAWLALLFETITTCLITYVNPHSLHEKRRKRHQEVSTNLLLSAVYVQGRNKFNANDQRARLGVKAFAFMWTAMACLLLSCILYCLGGAVGQKETGYSGREHRRRGFFSSQRSPSVEVNKEANP